ncbi:sugar phosphate isomerase/epimerase family protein [Rossellomorea marisflavi]|uniref:sugar phosphate isomerase/epimerase family protein n=1 Tax=Rossellomorea marisflavi TaxID=189381 RepID=UPI00064F50FE|nr:sugar phosphate isomerase/epimerase family protein [Rossellomorea marisflavi]KML08196.1 AP endonuclease [Rossellomorea marisflavi]MCM2603118.1 sugar phosphate isomerase/epimerase [Rossellomorea marisflavi]
MKVSVSMYSLASTIKQEGWSVADFIHYAKKISLDGVELLDFYWKEEDSSSEIIEAKEALHDTGLVVSAYDVSNNFVKESEEERAAEVEKILKGISVAKEFGTDIVRVFCGDLHGALTYEDGQQWIIDGLKACAPKAEAAGVTLAIENHGLLAGKSRQVEDIIKNVDSPWVKSTFDTGNFLLVHEEPQLAFDRLKREIVHVHFKDFREKEEGDGPGFKSTQGVELVGTVPGDGQVDLSYIVDGLKQEGYEGWLSIEYEGHDDAREANEEAVRRLRHLLVREGA